MGSTTYNGAALVFGGTLLALAIALVVGGLIAYRRNMERTATAVAVASGTTVLATFVLAIMETIPAQAGVPILIGEFGLVAMLFWVWMLAECAVREPSTGNDKIVWVIIILFTHVLGAALYYFARRPQRRAAIGR